MTPGAPLDIEAILQRLSVADAQKLLEKTRDEKEKKEKEMQAMGGSRYQDLIDAADQIVSMHEASKRLDTALGDMSALWEQMERAVDIAVEIPTVTSAPPPHLAPKNEESNDAVVNLIIGASERIWTALQDGDPLQALSIYKQVDGINVPDALTTELGFLALELDGLAAFPQRIVVCARRCLQVPKRTCSFYANALLVLAELQSESTTSSLHMDYFDGQAHAIDFVRKKKASERRVLFLVDSILSSLQHAEALFVAADSPLARRGFEASSSTFSCTQAACTAWSTSAFQHLRFDLKTFLDALPNVDAVAAFQDKIKTRLAAPLSPLVALSAVCQAIQVPVQLSASLWEIVAKDLVASKTQNLIGDAFDAAAAQFKATMHRDDASADAFVAQLDAIQMQVADPSARHIFTDECTRVFVEIISILSDLLTDKTASTHLHLAPLCLAIAASMPRLFPSSAAPLSAPIVKQSDVRAAFTAHATEADGRLMPQSSLAPLFETLHVPLPSSLLTDHLTSLSFHHVYFLSVVQTQGGAATGPVFEDLSRAFCRDWAAQLVKSHAQPLHDALASRYFGYSNEVWRSVYHACWTQTSPPADEDDEDEQANPTLVWLPWCASPEVSHLLFGVTVATSAASTAAMEPCNLKMHVRDCLMEWIVKYIHEVLECLAAAKTSKSPLAFGEACALQCVFDLYFVRVVVGETAFLRFGWGDQFAEMEPLLAWIDPVEWELYGPALVHLVTRQFHMTRLLYAIFLKDETPLQGIGTFVPDASLSMLQVAAPVPRFSLLPVPQPVKRPAVAPRLPPPVHVKEDDSAKPPPTRQTSIHHILSTSLLTTTATAAASATAAKGMSLLSSASSYLRE
ncbi:unnamed protein product [Aphanomyces euteiches]|uniref:Conserved oligomeric Golgi complex subunit 1 n=1 Tax=Aphanomyces euteiches TaxID=100861 RepID=A0A6G0XBH5_9STRA|nr:hypothetical protein Ae201684_006532 [Aphanomyces euteiches]KAH9090813.1 hypothetical protein Ae201684P_006218 [Aphanomyces euteiches]KAH9154886.1 hypothetical protein AeRB84_003084 [Aphanomyces euteiches]